MLTRVQKKIKFSKNIVILWKHRPSAKFTILRILKHFLVFFIYLTFLVVKKLHVLIAPQQCFVFCFETEIKNHNRKTEVSRLPFWPSKGFTNTNFFRHHNKSDFGKHSHVFFSGILELNLEPGPKLERFWIFWNILAIYIH